MTVAQEVETLKLYLDIERMRFEERLRTDFRIDPAAATALLPSLLLQPLVENAIKYAVSPQEEGARDQHRRATRRPDASHHRLGHRAGLAKRARPQQAVAAMTSTAANRVSTGVGLANIRDRLAQAYGDEHRFEIRDAARGRLRRDDRDSRSNAREAHRAGRAAPKPARLSAG